MSNRLAFSIDSILGTKLHQQTSVKVNPQQCGSGLSLSGSFSNSSSSSSSSNHSPPMMLMNLAGKKAKTDQDSPSTDSPDSKLMLNTPDKSANSSSRFSEDFSPVLSRIIMQQHHQRQQQQQHFLMEQVHHQQQQQQQQQFLFESQQHQHHHAALLAAMQKQHQHASSSSLLAASLKSPLETGHSLAMEQRQSPNPSMGRSPRVPFSRHQVMVLETKFRKTHYLSSLEVTDLANQLHLTETRVKIWFQNRRARERRENALGPMGSPTEQQQQDVNSLATPGSPMMKMEPSTTPPVSADQMVNLTPLILKAWAAQQHHEHLHHHHQPVAMTPKDIKTQQFNTRMDCASGEEAYDNEGPLIVDMDMPPSHQADQRQLFRNGPVLVLDSTTRT